MADSCCWLAPGAQLRLLARGFSSPSFGPSGWLIGPPVSMAAGFQQGVFQQVKAEAAVFLRRVFVLCFIG